MDIFNLLTVSGQRVAHRGIKARGHEDELRGELVSHGHHDGVEGEEVLGVPVTRVTALSSTSYLALDSRHTPPRSRGC